MRAHIYMLKNFNGKGHNTASMYDFDKWNRAIEISYLLNPKSTTGSFHHCSNYFSAYKYSNFLIFKCYSSRYLVHCNSEDFFGNIDWLLIYFLFFFLIILMWYSCPALLTSFHISSWWIWSSAKSSISKIIVSTNRRQTEHSK